MRSTCSARCGPFDYFHEFGLNQFSDVAHHRLARTPQVGQRLRPGQRTPPPGPLPRELFLQNLLEFVLELVEIHPLLLARLLGRPLVIPVGTRTQQQTKNRYRNTRPRHQPTNSHSTETPRSLSSDMPFIHSGAAPTSISHDQRSWQ